MLMKRINIVKKFYFSDFIARIYEFYFPSSHSQTIHTLLNVWINQLRLPATLIAVDYELKLSPITNDVKKRYTLYIYYWKAEVMIILSNLMKGERNIRIYSLILSRMTSVIELNKMIDYQKKDNLRNTFILL